MKQAARRLIAYFLCAALTGGVWMTASAESSADDRLAADWDEAVAAQDTRQVISLAGRIYDRALEEETDETDWAVLEETCALASWCAELEGDLEDAVLWLERQRAFAQLLEERGAGASQTVEQIDARLSYLESAMNVSVYALTDQEGAEYPDTSAPVSGTWYGSGTDTSRSEEPAVLVTVPFLDGNSVGYWLEQYRQSSSKYKQAEQGGVIQLFWDFSAQSAAGLDQTLTAEADAYIREGLLTLGRLDATVLLRVGGEANSWSRCDPDKYIRVFRSIAREAGVYDNIEVVFSVAAAGRTGVDFETFYPGDEYVDWIGVTLFRDADSGGAEGYVFSNTQYGADAASGTGVYGSDPLPLLRPAAEFAEEHGKPMVVSECGFAYWSDAGGGSDQTEYAVDQLTKLYAYVNMIYPQVKAVFYTGADPEDSGYTRALSGSTKLAQAYRSAVSENGGYLEQGQEQGRTWVPADQINHMASTLKLAVYALFPGTESAEVTYVLDGEELYASDQIPYSYELDTTALSPGEHLLWVTAEAGQFFFDGEDQGCVYRLYVSDTGLVLGEDNGEFDIQSASDWAKGLLMNAYSRGLVTPRTSSGLQQPITRLQFAELAVNLIEQTTGEEIVSAAATFTDTSDEAVLKAVAAGVTSGKGEGEFAPDDFITRQEICVMLDRVIRYVDEIQGTQTLSDTSTQLDARFTDGASVDAWALESVALLTNNGIMTGRDEGLLAPQDNITVEESIVLALALRSRF